MGLANAFIVHYDDGGREIRGLELYDFQFLARECGQFKHLHHSSAHANLVRRAVPCSFVSISQHYSLAA